MFGKFRLLIGVMALLLVVSTLSAGTAFAAKGSGGGKGGGGTTGTGSLTLVLLNSTDGLPHYGQQVTFTVSTTATTEPHVSLNCNQSGVLVYTTQPGYYAGYPWPWTQTMTLASGAWTGGAADCTATLYYFSGTSTVTLGTLNFHVYA